MPTNPPGHRPSQMAAVIAVNHHHRHPFRPMTARNRRHRLLSFPHPDLNLLGSSSHLRGSPKPSTPSAPPTFHRSLSTPCLSSGGKSDEPSPHNARVEIIMGRRGRGVHALMVEVAIALASGIHPVPAPSGLGGAYYLSNRAGHSFAVVKPASEGTLGLRRSVSVGETGVREAAAYLLDHEGFSDVPPTALIRISSHASSFLQPNTSSSARIASVQRFVPHAFDAGELGPSRFSVASVHRIGILDVRLLNVDRHSGNILVRASGYDGGNTAELVPIDHGLCLPELLDDPYFEWLHWPQARVPFSDTEIRYIAALDPFRDAELLRAELPLLREPSIRILLLCTIFLKRAAAAGLCLADIGDMMTWGFCAVDGAPASVLESICREVERGMANVLWNDDGRDGTHGMEEEEEFQFQMECEDGDSYCCLAESHIEHEGVAEVELPLLLRGRPNAPEKTLFMRNTSSKVLYPLDEAGMVSDCGGEEYRSPEKGEEEARTVGSLTRSVSFTVTVPSHHGIEGVSGGGKCMSFKGMSEEEWGLFLERFEEMLPEAFEARKSMGLTKQRLGSSCKF